MQEGRQILPPAGHPDSYYVRTAEPLALQPRLQECLQTDVCVIGGGYTGLSAALHLAERGYGVILLEAGRIGCGASGRNGGQLGSGQRLPQAVVERRYGGAQARLLWALAEAAKATIRERIARHGIPCELKPGLLMAAWKPGDVRYLRQNAEHLHRAYGYDQTRLVERGEMAAMLGTSRYFGGVLDLGAGHLHPLRLAFGLARAAVAAGARLFEGSAVVRIEPGAQPVVRTAMGEVRAAHVVLAMNGHLGRLVADAAARIMPINSFMIATEPLDESRARSLIRDDVAVADTKFVIDYYRCTSDHRLLFGGGETYRRRFPADIAALVRPVMLRVFPQLADVRIEHAWGGTLAITRSRMPHFARPAPGVYLAQGYSGHGLAMTTFAGRLIADAIAGDAERFDVMARLRVPRFPGGTLLRCPLLATAMLWYRLRDRL